MHVFVFRFKLFVIELKFSKWFCSTDIISW